jgi:hypothetical protein
MIYSQVLGHWATDYQNKLSICRFQYMHQIAPLHFIGVNAMNFQKPTIFEEEDFYLYQSYLVSHRPAKL